MDFSLTLAVNDLHETEAFYRRILNLSPEWGPTCPGTSPFLVLRCSQLFVVFRTISDLECCHPALLQNLTRHPLGVGLQLEFGFTDLDAILGNLRRQQWPICYELEDDEHRRKEIWLHDPDGYLLILNEENAEPKTG